MAAEVIPVARQLDEYTTDSILSKQGVPPQIFEEQESLPELTRTSSNISRHDPSHDRPSSSSTTISSYRSSPYPSPSPSNTSLGSSPEDDGGINFPTYDSEYFHKAPPSHNTPPLSPYNDLYSHPSSPVVESSTPTNETSSDQTAVPKTADDTAVKEEPSLQVDYLSHDWKEEEIWCSWKHIVTNRKTYGERSRLENASWRTWAKSKNNLSTVSPEKLNWMKDCDVTWLYGPLQTPKSLRYAHSQPQSSTNLSKSNSFLNKKPILKKRSVSEVMLQKSLSSSSLVRQAAEAVYAQRVSSQDPTQASGTQRRPTASEFITAEVLTRDSSRSDFSDNVPSSSCSSGLSSRDAPSKRHIRFDPTVEQCIAVDFKQNIVFEEPELSEDLSFSSEDEPVTMKPNSRSHPRTPGSSRNSFSSESKGIAMLPSTKLKNHGDDGMGDRDPGSATAHWRTPGRIPSSPSQETIRPSRPGRNFLIDGDDLDPDMPWEPSGAFHSGSGSMPTGADGSTGPMRRTDSGMLMPLDESEEVDYIAGGIIGRVMDTFNTARDIGHVIWNVGWRK